MSFTCIKRGKQCKEDWGLRLHAIQSMIPWCFAYDTLNYARYLPVYYAQMTSLPLSHPDIYLEFTQGHFSVQLSDQSPFDRVPVDQTIEVTVNKDTQTAGGTTGFSLKAAAVSRYYLTAEYRSAVLTMLRDIVHARRKGYSHPDLQQSRIKKDEEAVSAVENTLVSWVDPFYACRDLINISTGSLPPADIAKDIKEAHARGELAYDVFKKDRLE